MRSTSNQAGRPYRHHARADRRGRGQGGRYLIAKTLLEAAPPPWTRSRRRTRSSSRRAPLRARASQRQPHPRGLQEPLTGGVKEANGGGDLQLWSRPAGKSPASPCTRLATWVVITSRRTAGIDWDDATPYLGKGISRPRPCCTPATARRLTIGLCGPVASIRPHRRDLFRDKDAAPHASPRAAASGR